MTATPRVLDCGHNPSPHSDYTTGTAHTSTGKEICWECSYKREQEALKRTTHYVAFLASDGKTLTTWPGQTLARVTRLWTIPNNMAGKLYRFRAVDVHGAAWYGSTPGHGMYARMHKAKGA
jgi:hypothetical protein